jgi:ABC-type transport system involved in cytochrome c biogenesis permease subunit
MNPEQLITLLTSSTSRFSILFALALLSGTFSGTARMLCHDPFPATGLALVAFVLALIALSLHQIYGRSRQ